jgi:hypothetical protein
MRHITKILFLLLLLGSVLPILPVAAQDAPCTINTARRNGARLREAPARNGKAIGYLPTGIEFNVTGRFQDNRRGTWFLLIKEQVDPAITSAEVWVAATTVKTTGNCDIVPSLNPLLPRAGVWNMQSDVQFTVSCVDGGQAVIPFEALGVSSIQDEVKVVPNFDHFLVERDRFSRTADGKFINEALNIRDWDVGFDNGVVLVVVNSDTNMTATFIFNIVESGVQCSVNLNAAMNWVRER